MFPLPRTELCSATDGSSSAARLGLAPAEAVGDASKVGPSVEWRSCVGLGVKAHLPRVGVPQDTTRPTA